jgi:hypothetical protein
MRMPSWQAPLPVVMLLVLAGCAGTGPTESPPTEPFTIRLTKDNPFVGSTGQAFVPSSYPETTWLLDGVAAPSGPHLDLGDLAAGEHQLEASSERWQQSSTLTVEVDPYWGSIRFLSGTEDGLRSAAGLYSRSSFEDPESVLAGTPVDVRLGLSHNDDSELDVRDLATVQTTVAWKLDGAPIATGLNATLSMEPGSHDLGVVVTLASGRVALERAEPLLAVARTAIRSDIPSAPPRVTVVFSTDAQEEFALEWTIENSRYVDGTTRSSREPHVQFTRSGEVTVFVEAARRGGHRMLGSTTFTVDYEPTCLAIDNYTGAYITVDAVDAVTGDPQVLYEGTPADQFRHYVDVAHPGHTYLIVVSSYDSEFDANLDDYENSTSRSGTIAGGEVLDISTFHSDSLFSRDKLYFFIQGYHPDNFIETENCEGP